MICEVPDAAALPVEGITVHPVELAGSVRGVPWGFTSERLVQAVEDRTRDSEFSAALLWGGAELALPGLTTKTAVIDRIDCGWLTVWREARRSTSIGNVLRRTYWTALTAHYERWFAATGNQVVVVADSDANAIRRLARAASAVVIPNGVDMPQFSVTPARRSEPTVTFTGVLSFGPNRDAVEWFVNNCWHHVVAAVPSARLRIVGRQPTDAVRQLGLRPGVDVVGEVPSVAEELASTWVAIAPMRTGAGIKNKVLEAWATGTPVVMTSLATGGLSIPPDHAMVIADSPREFSARVVTLLQNRDLNGALGHSARLAAQLASWSQASDSMNQLLRTATRRPAAPYHPPASLRTDGASVAATR